MVTNLYFNKQVGFYMIYENNHYAIIDTTNKSDIEI